MIFVTNKFELAGGNTAIISNFYKETEFKNTGDNQITLEHSDDGINWSGLGSISPDDTFKTQLTKKFLRALGNSKVYANSKGLLKFETQTQVQPTQPISTVSDEQIKQLQTKIAELEKRLSWVEQGVDTDNDSFTNARELQDGSNPVDRYSIPTLRLEEINNFISYSYYADYTANTITAYLQHGHDYLNNLKARYKVKDGNTLRELDTQITLTNVTVYPYNFNFSLTLVDTQTNEETSLTTEILSAELSDADKWHQNTRDYISNYVTATAYYPDNNSLVVHVDGLPSGVDFTGYEFAVHALTAPLASTVTYDTSGYPARMTQDLVEGKTDIISPDGNTYSVPITLR